MIAGTAAERGSALAELKRQFAVDLGAAPDPQAAVAVVLRFIDDRSEQLLRRGGAAQAFLQNSADGMARIGTELDEASRAAWGELAPHVPQPPRPVSFDDTDLDAHELADARREAEARAVARTAAAAAARKSGRRRG
ncbi:hypothetical protein FDO65_10005 [Nakamurella flava]|uniref:Uncharacterized protein n=1 Tax=Nakamurella flava TaxID=2576308 RepID=A0A4U6QMI5_9ACTN|nr:hypothetical protein [Nakamurella flava]TKV61850.1 hypothetical protein FDO65_10005 [Nakamurella flava]